MKVKDIINHLMTLDPEENVCILMYDKSMFNHHYDDDSILSDEDWEKICVQFEQNDFDDVWQSVDLAVLDYIYK